MVLAGCGGDSRPRAPATPGSGSAPSPILSCGNAPGGWRPLPARAHGDALDAATRRSGIGEAGMLLVPGGAHGVALLSGANGPRVRAAIVEFLDAAIRRP